MATIFRPITEYVDGLPDASPLISGRAMVTQGGEGRRATYKRPGWLTFRPVNAPGRSISLADINSDEVLVNASTASVALLLLPHWLIPTSPSDATAAGLTLSINDTAKPYFRVRREQEGELAVNGFQPTDLGPVANQAAMVALSNAQKYDFVSRTDLGGAKRILTGASYANAAHWVSEATAGFSAGKPKVTLDYGEADANNPETLPIGHYPVTWVYARTVDFEDFWSAR